MASSRFPITKKYRFKPISAALAAFLLIGLGYAAVRIFAASGSASLYLSQSTGTFSNGQTVTVQVYVNTGGDPVNAVQADFSYPTSVLQFSSIDATNSAFSINASSTGGSGKVSLQRGTTTPVTGTALIATVHFTALATGSASLAFQGTSHVVRSTDNIDILTSTTGAAYTISAPSSTPSPTPVPTPTPTPITSTTKTPSATTKTSATPTPVNQLSSSPATGTTVTTQKSTPIPVTSPSGKTTALTVPVTHINPLSGVMGLKLAGLPVLPALLVLLALIGITTVAVLLSHRRMPDVAMHGSDQFFASQTPPRPVLPPAPSRPPSTELILPDQPHPETPPAQQPSVPPTDQTPPSQH